MYKGMNETESREKNQEDFANNSGEEVWSKASEVQVEERGQKDSGETGFVMQEGEESSR